MTLQDGYRAIRERAAIGATAKRVQIAVTGQDRAAYLQGLLTNDILALTPGSGCYSAWLSPQGRMLTDMHVLESGTMILLDVPAEVLDATLARLDQFIFSEDVQVASLAGSLGTAWVHGPQAALVIERVIQGAAGLGEWADYRHDRFQFAEQPVSIARISQLGVPGYCILLERSLVAPLSTALESAGAVAASAEAIDAARIEAEYPIFGVDMTDDTIPLEAGIEARAISFTKGCYVGQEVVIRVLHRGHGRVVRKLMPLRIDGVRPEAGAKLYSGEREVGVITSAAESPRSGVVALGYVHRDFFAPGTALEVDTHGGRAGVLIAERPAPSAV